MKSLQEFKKEYYAILFNFSKVLYSINIDKNILYKETDKHNKKLIDLLYILETRYTDQILNEDWCVLYLNLIDQISVTKNKDIRLSGYCFLSQITNQNIANEILKIYPNSTKIIQTVYNIFNHTYGDDFEIYKKINFLYQTEKKLVLKEEEAKKLILAYKKCQPIINQFASIVLKEKNIKLETDTGFKKLISHQKLLVDKGECMGLYSIYSNYLARLHTYQRNLNGTKEIQKELRLKFKILFEILIKYESSFGESMTPYLIEMGLKKASK